MLHRDGGSTALGRLPLDGSGSAHEACVMTEKQVAISWDLGKRSLGVLVSLISSKVVQRIVVPFPVSPGRKSLPTSGMRHMHTGESSRSKRTLKLLCSRHLCAPSSSGASIIDCPHNEKEVADQIILG